ncbi:hypothetical protein HDU76_006637 [Blyttiomyces sp. JEL0837]|nr:hypothetical protein HDU76_006637 [Blyttiomyces sp. JEL0837]
MLKFDGLSSHFIRHLSVHFHHHITELQDFAKTMPQKTMPLLYKQIRQVASGFHFNDLLIAAQNVNSQAAATIQPQPSTTTSQPTVMVTHQDHGSYPSRGGRGGSSLRWVKRGGIFKHRGAPGRGFSGSYRGPSRGGYGDRGFKRGRGGRGGRGDYSRKGKDRDYGDFLKCHRWGEPGHIACQGPYGLEEAKAKMEKFTGNKEWTRAERWVHVTGGPSGNDAYDDDDKGMYEEPYWEEFEEEDYDYMDANDVNEEEDYEMYSDEAF